VSLPAFPPPVIPPPDSPPHDPALPPPLASPAQESTQESTRRCRDDHGQATTEYALILLAAALVGLLVVAWATAGGAAGRIGQLFDQVVDSVISRL
jgi:Flp pilus assembly pilin Flp